MEEKTARNLKVFLKYLIAAAVGALFAVAVLLIGQYSAATDKPSKYRMLSDAFTFAGVLLTLFSALVFISSKGGFDGIGYALGKLVGMLVPFADGKNETYAEYKDRKHSGSSAEGHSCTFFCGIVYLAVSVIFTVLYYKVR